MITSSADLWKSGVLADVRVDYATGAATVRCVVVIASAVALTMIVHRVRIVRGVVEYIVLTGVAVG